MTVNPEGDLASPDCVRCLARYSDGGVDAFAIPKATLQQGPEEGWNSIARIVAHEWMTDGYIRQGTIVEICPIPRVDDPYKRARRRDG
jgi:hypothetical protein